MSNGVVGKPVWLSLALVVAFSLVAPGSAPRAAADELQQPQGDLDLRQSESALALVQPSDVLRADNVSQVSYADTEALEPDSESVSDIGPSYDGCCCYYPTRAFVAGVEATFLAARRASRGAINVVQLDDLATPAQVAFTGNSTAIDSDFFFSPRVWLGRRGERWGVETTFWYLDASSGNTAPMSAALGSGIGDASRAGLNTYTIDLEVTRHFQRNWWDLKASFGARYAEFNYDTGLVSASGFLDGNFHSGYAGMSRQFGGCGITGSLDLKRALRTTECSRTSLFISGRLSYIWDEPTYRMISGATVITGGGTAIAQDSTTLQIAGDDGVFIGELQAGIDWEYDLQMVPAMAFFRVVFEYQGWDADSGSNVNFGTLSLAHIPGVAQTTSLAMMNSDPRLDLIGLAVSAGFNW